MATVTTFPNGQVLTSSALTPETLLVILQPLTCAMLGIDPPDYSKVRVQWPQAGQPSFPITADICLLRVLEVDDEFNRIRDEWLTPNDSASVLQHVAYTRVWEVVWSLYGPTCFDHARLLKDALMMDFSHDTLALSDLYLVTDLPSAVYAPELFQDNWWKRIDLRLRLNEAVTETIGVASMASCDVIIEVVVPVSADGVLGSAQSQVTVDNATPSTGGVNSPAWEKHSVEFHQLAVSGQTTTITLVTRLDRQKVCGLSLYATTGFSGPGLTNVTVTVGDSATSPNYYTPQPFSISSTNAQQDTNVMGGPHGASSITLTFASTGAPLNALIAGVLDVELCLAQQP